MRSKIEFFLISVCLIYQSGLAQITVNDSASANIPLRTAIDLYYSSINSNSHLYNGGEYPGYNQNMIGNPYLDTTSMLSGSILYDGTLYENLPMIYDLYEDAVIINHKYVPDYRIRLVSEKIAYFSLEGHMFVRLVPGSQNQNMSTGFYDEAYNGKTRVFVKRVKIIRDDPVTADGQLKSRYRQYNSYFIKKNDEYFQVTNNKSLIKIFKPNGRDVKKYLKKIKAKFKKRPEFAIEQAAKYYDQLTK